MVRNPGWMIALATLAVACGSSNNDLTAGGGGGGSGASSSGGSGNAGSGGSSGSGGFGAGGTSGGSGSGSGGFGATSNDAGPQGCATATKTADAVPPVMEMVIDISGSMGQPAPGGGTKWSVTRDALGQAITAMPDTNALGMTLYPDTNGFGSCINAQQEVPIAALGPTGSTQRQTVQSTLQGANPQGGTPTHDAYLFGLNQLVASPLPGNKFMILITDGAPTYSLGCKGNGQSPVDNTALIGQVTNATNGGVRTFVIGSPGSETARTDLSKMATAGQTALPGCSDTGPSYCHFDMTTSTNLAQSLNDALATISGAALSCTYDIPPPPSGQTLDPGKVNVEYTPSGGSSQDIVQDPTCGNGWKYSTDGKQIILCGPACDMVKNDPNGTINIVFGCNTKVN